MAPYYIPQHYPTEYPACRNPSEMTVVERPGAGNATRSDGLRRLANPGHQPAIPGETGRQALSENFNQESIPGGRGSCRASSLRAASIHRLRRSVALPFSGEACRVAADAAVVLHTNLTDR